MAHDTAIVHPVFVLVAWTFIVLLRVAGMRLTSRLRFDDFKFGESAAVPAQVAIPNRNYMNLLELPVLFYVACVLLYVADNAPPAAVVLAWAYVMLRIAHSLVHLTYNNVLHRSLVFALSNFVLIGLWVCAGFAVAYG
jgi:hypothetical protein